MMNSLINVRRYLDAIFPEAGIVIVTFSFSDIAWIEIKSWMKNRIGDRKADMSSVEYKLYRLFLLCVKEERGKEGTIKCQTQKQW